MGISTTGWLVILYAGVNLIAGLAFALDKHKARRNAWRISEGTLLTLALLGPFGASGAMCLFRHKTRKAKFWLVPLALILHLSIIAYLAWKFFV
jgi:uncharacterized membrane protein YsdA (DUF1294 family)